MTNLQKLQTNSPYILPHISSSQLFKEWPSIYENHEECSEIMYYLIGEKKIMYYLIGEKKNSEMWPVF